MEKAKIIFITGLTITAEVNGGSYITEEKPDFPDDLSEITVEQGEETKEIRDAQIFSSLSPILYISLHAVAIVRTIVPNDALSG